MLGVYGFSSLADFAFAEAEESKKRRKKAEKRSKKKGLSTSSSSSSSSRSSFQDHQLSNGRRAEWRQREESWSGRHGYGGSSSAGDGAVGTKATEAAAPDPKPLNN